MESCMTLADLISWYFLPAVALRLVSIRPVTILYVYNYDSLRMTAQQSVLKWLESSFLPPSKCQEHKQLIKN